MPELALVRMAYQVVTLLCVSAAFLDSTNAESQDKGKDFFEHDYARGVHDVARTGESNQERSRAASLLERSHAAPSSGASVSHQAALPAAPVAAQNTDPRDGKQPWQIASVELFVNSADPAHLNQAVARALSLHKKGRFRLLGVSHIGDYRTLSAENRAEMEQLQIRYNAVASVFYGPQITQSPTWAFTFFDEVRLVEGCLDPERYIDSNGAEPSATKLDAMNKQEGELAGF